MKYQGILFDLDMTIFDFDAGNRAAVNALMDELDYHSPNRFEEYEAINLACWAALERGELRQSELRYVRFARFFRSYGLPGDSRAAADRFVQLLGAQAILLPHAEEALRAVAARRPVAFLTNGISQVQWSRLRRSSVRDVPVDMIVSEEVGVSKPSPMLFNFALKKLGWNRRETLMVGDSPTSDIAGANAAGIDACWLNPAGKPLPKGVHAEYVIGDIRECVEIAVG